jgi:hypothetical protein
LFTASSFLDSVNISGGVSDTNSKIVSGAGSTIVRKFFQPSSREFLGSSILDVIIEDDSLKLICNQHLDKTGFTNIDGDVDITLSYKIYYGRFK